MEARILWVDALLSRVRPARWKRALAVSQWPHIRDRAQFDKILWG